jgi:hypothetical protein
MGGRTLPDSRVDRLSKVIEKGLSQLEFYEYSLIQGQIRTIWPFVFMLPI